MVYYIQRYYDPEMGRWVNRDPVGEFGGSNLYAFVNNNAIDRWDYLGMSPLDDILSDILDPFKTECCNGKPYNPIKEGCCKDKVYNLLDECCCEPKTGEVASRSAIQAEFTSLVQTAKVWFKTAPGWSLLNDNECAGQAAALANYLNNKGVGPLKERYWIADVVGGYKGLSQYFGSMKHHVVGMFCRCNKKGDCSQTPMTIEAYKNPFWRKYFNVISLEDFRKKYPNVLTESPFEK